VAQRRDGHGGNHEPDSSRGAGGTPRIPRLGRRRDGPQYDLRPDLDGWSEDRRRAVRDRVLFGSSIHLRAVSGTGWYASGSPATATVPATVPVSSGSRRIFAGWSGDASGSSPTASILMDGPKVAIASWKLQYNLQINTPYGTALTAGWYDAGTQTMARLDMARCPSVSALARCSKAGTETPRAPTRPGPPPSRWTAAHLVVAACKCNTISRSKRHSAALPGAVVCERIVRTRVGECIDHSRERDGAPSLRRLERDASGASGALSNPIRWTDPSRRARRGRSNTSSAWTATFRFRSMGRVVCRRDAGNAPRARRGVLRRTDLSLLGLDRRRELLRDRVSVTVNGHWSCTRAGRRWGSSAVRRSHTVSSS